MREEQGLTPAEREFEEALRGLQPAGSPIHRDELMYRAGYTAARRRGRMWQGATLLMTMAFAVSLALHGFAGRGSSPVQFAAGPGGVEPAPVQSRPAWTDDAPTAGEPSYLLLRNEVLERGLARLPDDSAADRAMARPLTLRELLGEPAPAAAPARAEYRPSIVNRILLGDRS